MLVVHYAVERDMPRHTGMPTEHTTRMRHVRWNTRSGTNGVDTHIDLADLGVVDLFEDELSDTVTLADWEGISTCVASCESCRASPETHS